MLVLALIGTSSYMERIQAGTLFPLRPQIRLTGNLNERSNAELNDGIIPLWGSPAQGFAFLGMDGRYGYHNSWYGNLGFGLRGLLGQHILTGYAYADYSETIHGAGFWMINPGFQWLISQWDVTLNGYFPTNHEHVFSGFFEGNQVGGQNLIQFSGHTEWGILFKKYENIGVGADTVVGYTFTQFDHLDHLRMYLGGYYYNISGIHAFCHQYACCTHAPPVPRSHVYGTQAGIEFPIWHRIFASFNDSYDNVQHNKFTLALQWRLGGLPKNYSKHSTMQDRLLFRIPRHLGTLALGSGVISQTYTKPVNGHQLIRGNIWFFRPEGIQPTGSITQNDCTFEHPCKDISTTVINDINGVASNANFYLNTGTYHNPDPFTGFEVLNGQNIFGRMYDFCLPARGSLRPLVNDTLFLNGNNQLHDLFVRGQSLGALSAIFQPSIEILSSATGTVSINNSDITTVFNAATGAFTLDGIFNGSSAINIVVNHSTITVENTSNAFITTAVSNFGGGVYTINNSIINSTNNRNSSSSTGVFNTGTITLNDSIVNAAQNSENLSGGSVRGVNNVGGGTLTFNRSVVNAIQTGGAGFSSSLQSSLGLITSNQSAFNSSTQLGGGGISVGFNVSGGTVNLSESSVSVNGDTATLFSTPGSITDLGNNVCFENGTSVPCFP